VPPNERDTRKACASGGDSAAFAPNAIHSAATARRPGARTSPRARILVVDDEANARTALAELLRDEGFAVETAADGFKALPKIADFAPDLVVTDLCMPGMDGLDLMRKTHDTDPEAAFVFMTAHGAVETAVAAMRQGAADYLTKPIAFDQLVLLIDHELERRRLRREAGLLRQRLADDQRLPSLVGCSRAMRELGETVRKVAPSRASVLLTGESGTGKRLIASAIHEHSPRASKPFIAIAGAELTEEMLGKESGGGTLFLDEVGDIPHVVQGALVRYLVAREADAADGDESNHPGWRVVAASQCRLPDLVAEGRFRADLFYRLSAVAIDVPPLRERAGDAVLLAGHFADKLGRESGKPMRGYTDEALDRIARHAWPGNVRELENAVQHAVAVCPGRDIAVDDLPAALARAEHDDGLPPVPGSTVAELERYAILKTLEYTGGSTSRAAGMLGISPRKIQYRLREYAVRRRRS